MERPFNPAAAYHVSAARLHLVETSIAQLQKKQTARRVPGAAGLPHK
jgi:hypothetical protein